MNNLKRRVLSIVMFMLADGMLVKDLQKNFNKHEMERAWPQRGTLHLQFTSIDEIPEIAN